ncbi:MAG: DUF4395 domain-containing protein [Ilumatobacteraceae bacterium]|jgi:hypothetical protein
MRRWLGFPNPVNETSARFVAAGAVAQGIVYLATHQWWVLLPLTYGFLARVLTGPRLSPLGAFVTHVVTPAISRRFPGYQHRFVAGSPKRFAQGVGLAFSGGALAATAAGAPGVATVLIAGLVIAATLEAVFAFCLGCVVFQQLMRIGVIPESICLECADISQRLAAATR